MGIAYVAIDRTQHTNVRRARAYLVRTRAVDADPTYGDETIISAKVIGTNVIVMRASSVDPYTIDAYSRRDAQLSDATLQLLGSTKREAAYGFDPPLASRVGMYDD